jgi:hypothetical protein
LIQQSLSPLLVIYSIAPTIAVVKNYFDKYCADRVAPTTTCSNSLQGTISMAIYYLYIKTHSITGLKYLGHTTKNPLKYKGSGLHWKRHLKKHGPGHSTEILMETSNKDDIKHWGLYYSNKWDVVNDPNWANLIPESGEGVIQNSSSLSKSIRTRKKNGTISNGISAMNNPEVQKKAGLHSRKTYRFVSPDGIIVIATGLAEFCKQHGLDAGNMSSIAHGRKYLKTHKGWSCTILKCDDRQTTHLL